MQNKYYKLSEIQFLNNVNYFIDNNLQNIIDRALKNAPNYPLQVGIFNETSELRDKYPKLFQIIDNKYLNIESGYLSIDTYSLSNIRICDQSGNSKDVFNFNENEDIEIHLQSLNIYSNLEIYKIFVSWEDFVNIIKQINKKDTKNFQTSELNNFVSLTKKYQKNIDYLNSLDGYKIFYKFYDILRNPNLDNLFNLNMIDVEKKLLKINDINIKEIAEEIKKLEIALINKKIADKDATVVIDMGRKYTILSLIFFIKTIGL